MTLTWKFGDEERESAVSTLEADVSNLTDHLTVLELAVGEALWKHAKVRVPRDAMTRISLELSEGFGDSRCSLLSNTTYHDFYNSYPGANHVQHIPPAEEMTLQRPRNEVSKFATGPGDFRDASCI